MIRTADGAPGSPVSLMTGASYGGRAVFAKRETDKVWNRPSTASQGGHGGNILRENPGLLRKKSYL